MKMRINHIEASSYVDGPGERTVLFAQGCPIHCPGCQSRHTWEPSGGHVEEVEDDWMEEFLTVDYTYSDDAEIDVTPLGGW